MGRGGGWGLVAAGSGEVASRLGNPPGLGEEFQSVLLDDGEELEGHAAGSLGAGLPLFDGGLAGVEVAREDGLADALALAQSFDLVRLDGRGDGEAGGVEAAHGRLVDGTYPAHRRG